MIQALKNPFFGRENGGAVIESPWFERPGIGSRGCLRGMVFAGTGGEGGLEGQVITTNQKRDPAETPGSGLIRMPRSALKAWRRRRALPGRVQSFLCFRSGCYSYTGPEGARGRIGCLERRRVLDRSAHNSGVAMPRRVFTACGVEAGRRRGRSSPGLSDEVAMAGGGMPAVSRGMMQESPLILSSRPGRDVVIA